MIFNEKYENYKIEWEGYYTDTKRKQQPLFAWGDNRHEVSILVKMDPSESNVFADLVLSVSSGLYKKNKSMFE